MRNSLESPRERLISPGTELRHSSMVDATCQTDSATRLRLSRSEN